MSNKAGLFIVALAGAANILTASAQEATPPAPPTATGDTVVVSGREVLRMLKPPRPKHPRGAQGISGWVRVECVIAPNGLVESVRIVESEPAGVFDQAAIEAMWEARFNRSKSKQPRTMVQRLIFAKD